MSYYSRTGNTFPNQQINQTTSGDSTQVAENYEFSKTQIIFTDTQSVQEDAISEETEKNFYKKAFETKSL